MKSIAACAFIWYAACCWARCESHLARYPLSDLVQVTVTPNTWLPFNVEGGGGARRAGYGAADLRDQGQSMSRWLMWHDGLMRTAFCGFAPDGASVYSSISRLIIARSGALGYNAALIACWAQVAALP